jgi:hypothetical protein
MPIRWNEVDWSQSMLKANGDTRCEGCDGSGIRWPAMPGCLIPGIDPTGQGLRIDFGGGQHLEEIVGVECADHACRSGASLQRLLLAEQTDHQAANGAQVRRSMAVLLTRGVLVEAHRWRSACRRSPRARPESRGTETPRTGCGRASRTRGEPGHAPAPRPGGPGTS